MLLKKEIKINMKSLLIWTTSVSIIIIMVILLYPVAITKMGNLDDMMRQFPKEIMKALNLESYDWDKVLNYFSYEFQYIMLASAIFGALLGSGTFSREETSKSIQFLYSKPISRTKIFFSKVTYVFIYILLYNLIVYAVTALSIVVFVKDQTLDHLLLAKIYIGLFLVQITFASIGIIISTVLKRPRSAAVLSSATVIFTYILGMISKIADEVKNMIYISPIHYMLADVIVLNNGFETKYLIIISILVPLLIFVSWLIYRRKDFNI